MKIQLVNPPISKDFSSCSRSGCFPPLDLLSLASFLNIMRPNIEVEILDGDLLPLDEIISKIDADIVGIGPKIFSYTNCLILAQYANKNGSRVIIGGTFASAMPKAILNNNDFLEAVIIGNGEEAVVGFSDGLPKEDIVNIAYKNTQEIKFTPQTHLDINNLPPIRYENVEISSYMSNFKNKFPAQNFKRPMSYYSQKGCYWYDKTGGCIFCRQQNSKNIRKNPVKFWSEIKNMVVKYKVDLVWDVSDTFTEPINWVKSIVEKKPSDIDCQFYVYGRAIDINEQMVRLLKKFGCFEILIGVESGNNSLLKRANKGIKRENIINAVRLCAEYGIKVFPTYLLGLPGENESSLEDTLSLAKEIMGFGNIDEISSAILFPLPGSRIFYELSNKLGNPSWLINSDKLDLFELQKLYVDKYLQVDFDNLIEYNKYITTGCIK